MEIPDTFTVDTDRLLRNANLNTSHGALELRRSRTLIQFVIGAIFDNKLNRFVFRQCLGYSRCLYSSLRPNENTVLRTSFQNKSSAQLREWPKTRLEMRCCVGTEHFAWAQCSSGRMLML